MLGSKFVKFLMLMLKQQVNSFSNFAFAFFIVMTCNSSIIFELIHILLWMKGSHQSPNFKTFECSGENLPNSSCYFSNHKPVFLQILHHSSVWWKITPLYLLLAQTLDTFECSGQKLSNSSRQVHSSSNFSSFFIVMTHYSSVNFKPMHFLL